MISCFQYKGSQYYGFVFNRSFFLGISGNMNESMLVALSEMDLPLLCDFLALHTHTQRQLDL